jgi:DNA-binding XRE family transcriptional regulator
MPKKLNNKKLHKLKYWRCVLELTQENMGVLLGYSKANYSQKESGAIEFTLREMRIIQKEFNKRLAKMGQPLLTLDDIFLA